MSIRRTRAVAWLELRAQVRAGRLQWLATAGLTAVAIVFTYFLRDYLGLDSFRTAAISGHGRAIFGWLVLFLVAITWLIAPAFAGRPAGGIGEEFTAIPAVRPGEVAVGRFLAAWCCVLTIPALAFPFELWVVLKGYTGVDRAVVAFLVTALLIGVICAVSQAMSALLSRASIAALCSYLTVFALIAGTAIAYQVTPSTWWLVAPNPAVVAADATPIPPEAQGDPLEWDEYGGEALTEISGAVRLARSPSEYKRPRVPERDRFSRPAVWPYGLGFHLVLMGGALAITARRYAASSAAGRQRTVLGW